MCSVSYLDTYEFKSPPCNNTRQTTNIILKTNHLILAVSVSSNNQELFPCTCSSMIPGDSVCLNGIAIFILYETFPARDWSSSHLQWGWREYNYTNQTDQYVSFAKTLMLAILSDLESGSQHLNI